MCGLMLCQYDIKNFWVLSMLGYPRARSCTRDQYSSNTWGLSEGKAVQWVSFVTSVSR